MSTEEARLTPSASALIRFSALTCGPLNGPAQQCKLSTRGSADGLLRWPEPVRKACQAATSAAPTGRTQANAHRKQRETARFERRFIRKLASNCAGQLRNEIAGQNVPVHARLGAHAAEAKLANNSHGFRFFGGLGSATRTPASLLISS
jgi:hypothetical protein